MQESGTVVDGASVIARSLRDPEAFSVLFRRYGSRIQRYVTRRIGPDAAEDVVAETFLLAFRQRDRYDVAHASALPWLYGIATNLTGRHRRNEIRSYNAVARAGADPVTEPFTDRIEAAVTASAAYRALAAALAALPPPLVLGLVAGHAGTSTPPAASPGQASLTIRLVTDRAAAAALGQPAVRPGQWVYRLIRYKQAGFPGGLLPDSTETTWMTADGILGHAGGPTIRPVLPALPYADLGSLPPGTAALERYLADQHVRDSRD